jgi:hypothetical protein
MTDERLLKFMSSVGYPTMISPYETEDDESIAHFIWLLDVPEKDLCEVQDDAILLSFNLYDPAPVPFVIGVADAEKSSFLRADAKPLGQASAALGTAHISNLDAPNTTAAQTSEQSLAFKVAVVSSWNVWMAPTMPNALGQVLYLNSLAGTSPYSAGSIEMTYVH